MHTTSVEIDWYGWTVEGTVASWAEGSSSDIRDERRTVEEFTITAMDPKGKPIDMIDYLSEEALAEIEEALLNNA